MVSTNKKIIFTDRAPKPIGPYSQGVLAGNPETSSGQATLYVSGQIGIDAASGNLIIDNITNETKQVMENIGAILNAGGMNFENVVKATIFLKDLNNFSAVNEAYGKYFPANPPARETVQVARLPRDVNVEISVIAVK